MDQTNSMKEKVEEAHLAVESLPEEYRLEGFKIVLSTLLSGHSIISAPVPVGTQSQQTPKTEVPGSSDWQSAIADRLGIPHADILKLYWVDGEGALKLAFGGKSLPKSRALAMKHIAILFCAGRQAARFDEGETSSDDIRKECDRFSVVDKKNFATYLKQLKPNFQPEGKGLRVIHPGFEEAGKIAMQYLGQENKE